MSNHGSRQVDPAPASLDALPGVAAAVAGRVPVLLDSGVRTGADVFLALALGAQAVVIGRLAAYGLAPSRIEFTSSVTSVTSVDFVWDMTTFWFA